MKRRRTRNILRLLKEWMDERLEDGLPKLSVNGVSMGHALISLYKATGEQGYLDVAVQLAEYLKNDAERFADGIFQHTVNSEVYQFPQQAWVDTMMMAGYFLVRMGRLLERDDYLEDGLKQYHGHEEFLQDPETNLYYHGWDHLAQNHMSGVFWARGNAWAALTMAKALDEVHVTHPSFMIIEGSLRDQLAALVRLQSRKRAVAYGAHRSDVATRKLRVRRASPRRCSPADRSTTNTSRNRSAASSAASPKTARSPACPRGRR